MIAKLAGILGLDGDAVGRANLERAAAQAMARLGVSDPTRYLAILRADPAERRRLAGESVVQETWFFRDIEPFAMLGRLARTLPRPLRLLSAPCATGEEPYSMAMALMAAGLAPEEFTVDAADAHAPALDKARLGRFGPGSFRAPLADYSRYFRAEGPDALLSGRVRQSVRFFEADVLDPHFLCDAAPYAVIFCRNLLLYLDPPARKALAATLRRLLAPGGLLFAGHAEVAVLSGLGFAPAPHPRAFACTHAPATLSAPSGHAPGAGSRTPCPPPGASIPSPVAWQATPAQSNGPASRHGSLTGTPPERHAPPGGPPAASALSPARRDDPRALADAGRLDEALAVLTDDLAALGPSAERFHLLGVTYLALGRDQDAEEALRKAVYLDPGHAGALTHLELLHASAGRAEAASRLAGRAKRAGGERP